MNSCPHCGRESNSTQQRCSACPADLVSKQDLQGAGHKHQVIEPEVVDSNRANYEQKRAQWSHEQSSSNFKVWTFNQSGGLGSRNNDSCLPGLITIGIALSLLVQYGLLASIGFLVFYAIGSAIGFFVIMRNLMQGRAMSPWVMRVVIWLICAFITIGLAG